MREFQRQPLPVRRIPRAEVPINGGNNSLANPPARAKVSLEDVRAQVLEIKRRLNALDALLRQATDSTTE
jgi:hypothetical protein